MVNKCYKNKLRKAPKGARKRYQNLSDKEKEKRQKKAQDRYKNLSEEEKVKKHQYHCNKNILT